jgi:hypothetical protein
MLPARAWRQFKDWKAPEMHELAKNLCVPGRATGRAHHFLESGLAFVRNPVKQILPFFLSWQSGDVVSFHDLAIPTSGLPFYSNVLKAAK